MSATYKEENYASRVLNGPYFLVTVKRHDGSEYKTIVLADSIETAREHAITRTDGCVSVEMVQARAVERVR